MLSGFGCEKKSFLFAANGHVMRRDTRGDRAALRLVEVERQGLLPRAGRERVHRADCPRVAARTQSRAASESPFGLYFVEPAALAVKKVAMNKRPCETGKQPMKKRPLVVPPPTGSTSTAGPAAGDHARDAGERSPPVSADRAPEVVEGKTT